MDDEKPTRRPPEIVIHNGVQLAIIVRAEYVEPGIHFLTPHDYSQQLACMYYEPGKKIPAHVHNPVHRDVTYSLEALFIRKGKLRVDLYAVDRTYVESRILAPGDVIFLAAGGHGFEVLEAVDMIEIKQGPYSGEADKTRISAVAPEQIIVRGNT